MFGLGRKARQRKKLERQNARKRWVELNEGGFYFHINGIKEMKKSQAILEKLGFICEGSPQSLIDWLNNFSNQEVVMITKMYNPPKYSSTRLEVFEMQEKNNQILTSYEELVYLSNFGVTVN